MKKITLILSLALALFSCEKDNSVKKEGDNYNRTEILSNWADNIIIPTFKDNVSALEKLNTTTAKFTGDVSLENLKELRSDWLTAYKKWQHASLFVYGPAEDAELIKYVNIHPVNVNDIKANITAGNVDLTKLSTFNAQGFPALDYLLYGVADKDQAIVDYYKNKPKSKAYLQKVSTRLFNIVREVSNTWDKSFRNEFVANNGNTNKAALNKFTNNYIEHFEKYVRLSKVGTPAGKYLDKVAPETIEGLYSKVYSKTLLLEAIKASKNVFEGKAYNGTEKKASFKSYLDDLKTMKGTENLSDVIVKQFQTSYDLAATLNDDFALQVAQDKSKMLNAYDELNRIVLYTKTNMLTAMNIVVDYVDNDGD